MSDRLNKSSQTTCTATRNAISSVGLQDGQQLDLFGPARVPANRLAQSAARMQNGMKGIYGPRCTGSSNSAALQSLLANRLSRRLPKGGCALYEMTWKVLTMPWGLPVCQLAVSTRRTNACGCTGYPTLTARDSRTLKGGRDRPGKKGGPSLIQYLLNMGFVSGRLNHRKAGWLMGYPEIWSQCAVTAMQSSRKSRRSSSKRTAKQESPSPLTNRR